MVYKYFVLYRSVRSVGKASVQKPWRWQGFEERAGGSRVLRV